MLSLQKNKNTMTRGRRTCKILKEIRQQIADKNDIEYVTSECHFRGECEGTCPKCEEELKYLENELQKRRQLGKAVAIAGIALGMVGTFSDCTTYYLPIIVTSAYTQAAQGTGAVKGEVFESDGKTPLEFASVRLMQDKTLILGAVADERGFFIVDSVPVGKYEIQISYIGYENYIIKEFEIEESTMKDIKVRLRPSQVYYEPVIIGGM